jgi:hypothetical protein
MLFDNLLPVIALLLAEMYHQPALYDADDHHDDRRRRQQERQQQQRALRLLRARL